MEPFVYCFTLIFGVTFIILLDLVANVENQKNNIRFLLSSNEEVFNTIWEENFPIYSNIVTYTMILIFFIIVISFVRGRKPKSQINDMEDLLLKLVIMPVLILVYVYLQALEEIRQKNEKEIQFLGYGIKYTIPQT